ncbi:MAG: cytochrome oxidase Cu insertion factor (SCO1/SenC/PrrC family) [Lentimonas sp.]|jgi:cytochrome oxidase Cu insertion factor (SCO1/SenC/PrrC family)
MAKKTRAGRTKVGIAFLLLFGPAFLLLFISTRGCEHKFVELDDYGKIVDYQFKNVKGETKSSADYKGDVVLITTLQETCPDSCAISLWHLNQTIYKHIYDNKRKQLKQVRIISFVTDGEGNPVEDLSTVELMLKDRVQNYDPSIWILASGDAKSVYSIKNKDGSDLMETGDQYFGGEAFQELILLADKSNHLRMVLNGSTEGMIRRMKQNLALLQKQYDKENAK